MYDEFFSTADRLRREGVPFATATVVRVDRPTSGKPGDKAIVTLDGVMHGWIGGSCAQPTVVAEALAALAADRPRLVRLSPDPDPGEAREGVEDRPMTCFSGGTMEIFVEPQHPQPRLVLVGDLPVSQALAHLGKAMSYQVIAVDPEGGSGMAHADRVLPALESLASVVTPLTFIVVATHGRYDEPALACALATPAPYIGLVASRKRARTVLEYLGAEGHDAAALARIKAPAGIDIQARRGDEIALSIMAEIVQRRRGVETLAWNGAVAGAGEPAGTEAAVSAADEASAAAAAPRSVAFEVASRAAIDPVCGMTVQVATARASYEHQGVTYYFCCGGCMGRFATDPDSFLPD